MSTRINGSTIISAVKLVALSSYEASLALLIISLALEEGGFSLDSYSGGEASGYDLIISSKDGKADVVIAFLIRCDWLAENNNAASLKSGSGELIQFTFGPDKTTASLLFLKPSKLV